MTILVTGGSGYLGSHTARALREGGFRVVSFDNLVHGHHDLGERLGVPLVEGQLGNRPLLDQLLSAQHPATAGEPIQAVVHCPADASAGHSVKQPERCYRNNIGNSLVLVEALLAEGKRRGTGPLPLVFSSTSAIYGIPPQDHIPIRETCPLRPIHPDGRSKLMVERLLSDCTRAHGLSSVVFRSFNAAGAHPDGDSGEDHAPETQLIPLVLDAMAGHRPFVQIHGDDYPTPDGTCIRDYVHVCDLAHAHLLSLQQLLAGRRGHHVYNLGNEVGCSVQQVIDSARVVTQRDVPVHIGPRRQNDPPVLIASTAKARRELGWQPRFQELDTMIRHAWSWSRRRHA